MQPYILDPQPLAKSLPAARPNPAHPLALRGHAPLRHTIPGQAMTVQDMTPIIEVERKEGSGEWWSMPLELSSELYQAYEKKLATEFTFVWDWQDPRWGGSGKTQGSYEVDGETTNYSRYSLCFNTMTQKNLDSGRVRRFRVVFMKPGDAWASMS